MLKKLLKSILYQIFAGKLYLLAAFQWNWVTFKVKNEQHFRHLEDFVLKKDKQRKMAIMFTPYWNCVSEECGCKTASSHWFLSLILQVCEAPSLNEVSMGLIKLEKWGKKHQCFISCLIVQTWKRRLLFFHRNLLLSNHTWIWYRQQHSLSQACTENKSRLWT